MAFKLKTLTVENFIVFKDRVTITFSDSHINNIIGVQTTDSDQSNGVGKSLIIDAISVALFGKGIRASYLNDYISPFNLSGGIYVGLALVDSTNNILKIERWKRPNSDVTKAKLWLNGTCISKDSTVSKIDEMLQSRIGISHNNFISCIFSVMIPGFLRLRPSQRFEILEQALAVKKIESVVKKINTAIKSELEQLTATNASLLDKSSKLSAEQTKRDIYIANYDSIKHNLASHRKELDSFIQKESIELDKLGKYKTLLLQITNKLMPLEKEKTTTESRLSVLHNQITSLINKRNTVLASFKETEAGHIECVICKSQLSTESQDSVKEHYDTEVSLLKDQKTVLSNTLTSLNTKIAKLSSIKAEVESNVSITTRTISCIHTEILSTEKMISNLQSSLSLASSELDETLLNSLKSEVCELSLLKQSIEKNIKIGESWKQVMSKNGLRLAYIKEEVSTLSALASKYTSLAYNENMKVCFFVNNEKDTPTLDFTVNNKSANTFSTGEGRRLEIAITLSLISLLKTSGLSLDFIILDEAFDGLSVSSKNTLLKVITSLSKDYQVIMISHDDMIKSLNGNVITVEKNALTGHSIVTTQVR